MSSFSAGMRTSRLAALALAVLVALFVAACGGDETTSETDTDADATTPSVAPSPSESVVPTPTEDATDATGDVDALVAELESCLQDGGLETETEEPDLAIYGEDVVIDVTFDYGGLVVPGAVTLYVFSSEDAAAKAKKQIDKNLLEGDSETLLRGQVVVDDFGTTLDAPEAADQAEVVHSCTT